jgi:hypothetical protein
MREARTSAGDGGPLTLIHRSKVPNPRRHWVSGLSYTRESGCSEVVIRAAFLIAVTLSKGGYDAPTR